MWGCISTSVRDLTLVLYNFLQRRDTIYEGWRPCFPRMDLVPILHLAGCNLDGLAQDDDHSHCLEYIRHFTSRIIIDCPPSTCTLDTRSVLLFVLDGIISFVCLP